jgi:hypothetical protein
VADPEVYRLSFVITRQHAQQALRLRTRGRQRTFSVVAGLALVVVGVGYFLVGRAESGRAGINDWLILLLVAGLGALWATGLLTRLIVYRQWQRHPGWTRPMTCTVSDDALVLEQRGARTRYEWSYFAPAIETTDLVVLAALLLPNWVVLPRESAADDEEWGALCGMLARLTSMPAPPEAGGGG